MINFNEDSLSRYLLLLIILNPILDLLTGIYLNVFQLNSKLTPGIIVRNIILLFMIYYVVKNKIRIKYLFFLVTTFILTNVVQIFSGIKYSMFLELQYFLKFLYNILMLVIGYEIIKSQNKEYNKQLFYYLTLSGIIYSIVILGTFLTGTDYKTYSHGLSSKGLFFAGNDLAAILAVIYPLSAYLYFKSSDKNKKLILFYNVLIMISLTVVGTRVAFLAIIVTMIMYILFILLSKEKQYLKQYIVFVITMFLSFNAFSYIAQVTKGINIIDNSIERQQMNLEKTKYDSTTYVLSSRNIKFKWAFDDYKDANFARKIFGIARGTQEQTVEMDFVEIWLYYGIFGLIVFCFYIISFGVSMLLKIRNFKKDILYVALFTSLFLGFGSSFLAGHVLFSVSAGTYAFLVLALSTAFYSNVK